MALVLALVLAALLPLGASVVGAEREEPTAHAGLRCSGCHLSGPGSAAQGTKPVTQGAACQQCHNPGHSSATRSALRFHDDPGRPCLDCHSFHETGSISAGGSRLTFDHGNGRLEGHCSSCHGSEADLARLSEGHRAAAEFYHAEAQTLVDLTPSEGCLVCHATDPRYEGRSSPSPYPAPMFMETASHAFGVPVALGSEISSLSIRWELDPRIRLFDGRMECQTCHQIAGGSKKLLVQFAHPYQLCLGCHERRTEARRVAQR